MAMTRILLLLLLAMPCAEAQEYGNPIRDYYLSKHPCDSGEFRLDTVYMDYSVKELEILHLMKKVATQLDSLIKLQLRDYAWDGKEDSIMWELDSTSMSGKRRIDNSKPSPLTEWEKWQMTPFYELYSDMSARELDSLGITFFSGFIYHVRQILKAKGFFWWKEKLYLPSDTLYPVPEWKRGR